MNAYIVDTECTTRDDDREVIELAWIRLQPGHDLAGVSDRIDLHPVDTWQQRYRPSKPSDFGAIAVHHILPDELEDCAPAADATLPNGCTYIVGHSIDFDWQALGSPDVKRICTRAMAEHVWPEADSYSQSALLYMLLGATESTRKLLRNAHSALTDCENNLTLLWYILCCRREIKTWSALHEFSEECRIPLKMPITQARGTPLTEIDDGLLDWCLRQYWMPVEHPYLHEGLMREHERRTHDPDDDIPF